MKQVIALRYYQSNAGCDMLFNTAVHYGLRYTEYENQMLFFIREEIADERTAYFFLAICCATYSIQLTQTINIAIQQKVQIMKSVSMIYCLHLLTL